MRIARGVLFWLLCVNFCWCHLSIGALRAVRAISVSEEVSLSGFRLFPRVPQSEASTIFFRDLLLPKKTYSIDWSAEASSRSLTSGLRIDRGTLTTSEGNVTHVQTLRDADGHLYVCRVPADEPATPNNAETVSMDVESEPTIDLDAALQKQLKDKCFYRQGGWRVFEFCFHRHVRHFHWERRRSMPAERERIRAEIEQLLKEHVFPEGPNGEPGRKRFLRLLIQAQQIPPDGSLNLIIKDEVCMGMYDEALDRERIRNGTNLITSGAFFSGRRWQAPPQAANGAASRVDRGSDAEYRLESDGRVLPVAGEGIGSAVAYLVQPYTRDGDHCDITGRPRRTMVRYRCIEDVPRIAIFDPSPVVSSFIASVHERSTCEYDLVFVTDAVCSHPAFVSPARHSVPVVCERMSSEMEAINISPGSAQHPALHRS